MYTTEIVMTDSFRQVGPTFFSGGPARGEYETLAEAREAAVSWAIWKGLAEGTYTIISRIVGCL